MEINPLKQIFKLDSNGEPTSHLISLQYISNFFDYLFNNINNEESPPSVSEKIKIISTFCNIIKENRTISEFFSDNQDKSIYLYLFDLYLSKSSTDELKKEINSLLIELRINLQIDKKIFEYLFKNLSKIYTDVQNDNDKFLYDNLSLLNIILGETENYINPKNYLVCNGQGKIVFEPEKDKEFQVNNHLIFILNFFINIESENNEESSCQLITLKLEKKSIQLDINYKNSSLMVKDKIIEKFPFKEWINLIIVISPNKNNNMELFSYINGEIQTEKHEIYKDINLSITDKIKSIEFFDNFFGEISSIILLSQKEVESSQVKSPEFMEFFKNNKMGIWKKKNYNEFMRHISKFKYTVIQQNKNLKMKKESIKKLNNMKKESGNIEEIQKSLKDDLLFIISPFNYIYTCPNIIEDCLGKNHSFFYGHIRIHKYIAYQNKIESLLDLKNLLPIAEMFLMQPNLLSEKNLELFLKIIENILNYRKHNIKSAKSNRFFKILCLFLEKFPKPIFTEKILDAFINIGKAIFKNDSESLCKSYFKHILLNEKILSKYNSDFQIKFWNYIHLFCQSDKTQIGNFINMSRLSLLLRFYDRKKYQEMCCEEHLNIFKEEYIKNKKIMNPPLNKKLSIMKDVLNDIIYFQEPENSFYLFKLLTLDLSPCLIKFILNVFKKAFEGHKDDLDWNIAFINVLIKNKYESIIINTFVQGLPDIRLDILELMFYINSKVMDYEHKKYIRQCEMMLKPFLLPNEIFYINDENKKESKEDNKNNEQIKNEIIINNVNENEGNENNINSKQKIFIEEKEEDKNIGKLIIKDDYYQNYIDKLFSYLILWSLDIQLNRPLKEISLNKGKIKNVNILHHLFELDKKLKNIDFSINLIKSIDSLMEIEQNCFNAIHNNKFIVLIIELAFSCYINSENEEKRKKYIQCYNDSKNVIIKIYINSIKYAPSNDMKQIPSRQLEILFIWCDRILLYEKNRYNKNIIYSFIDEIIFDLLTSFKINFETNMEFNINENSELTNGYYFNNYIVFISKLFNFCFQFRLDIIIYNNSLSVIEQEYKNEISLPDLFVYTMRIDQSLGNKINKSWIDFKYTYEIYHRVKFIWQKENLYKKYNKKKKKFNNKIKKYEDIIENIILNKSDKNTFKNELNFLFYQLTEKDIIIIEPVIKIIQIFIMCMISVYKNKNEDNDFLSWIKEFGKLLRFLIISSTNLIMKTQVEFYEKIQQRCLYSIIIGFSFLKQCLLTSNTCKNEIEKILIKNFLFCLILKKFEINYNNRHKKQRLFSSTKFNKNDISNCAVLIMFNKYFFDKNGQAIFNLEYIEDILTENNYYEKIKNIINSTESVLDECIFKNKNLVQIINDKYFCLNSIKPLIDLRFKEIEKLKDNTNYNYSDNLLELLPSYEKELAKYSNNSLEKNLEKKNFYRKIKKSIFSWNGLWSDKSIFYDENISNKILKYRLKNYYTKSLMRPLLVPILDINYYLPNFSSFETKNYFNEEPKQIIDLNLDKILKSENYNDQDISKSDINININNNNSNNENILRNIYMKSNPKIVEKLMKINDKLDFGKEEEEYNLVEEKEKSEIKDLNQNDEIIINKSQSKIYFLSCLVKTSHHIKGVCFIDQTKLNFKIFLNQQTGKSMNGINMSFTDTDEDYDPERKTCYGSYFMFHHKDKDLYKISIKYSDIKLIFRRKYYYKDSALEIFTIYNKSFYFNFKYEIDRETVLQNIVKKMGDCYKIILDLKDTKDNFDNVIGFEQNLENKNIRKSFFKKNVVGISDKIKLWKKFQISNFELIMWLNVYSNRSYNDLSQYPIFPWILIDFQDPLKKEIIQNNLNVPLNNSINKISEQKNTFDYNYRDLSIPMGMLEINEKCIQRKELFILNYDELKSQSDEFEDQKPYYFGSNYSNPIYICNFLIRLFPFSNISIELQGNKLDASDRIFFSISKTFEMCTSLKTDVRELIPEFFYLPEMFLNLNNIDLGTKENGDKVDEVITPCNNNKYKFIEVMKNILENNKVSLNLQNWIDLIFGYKSRGKEAELAKNIFSQYSYQENVNLNKAENKNLTLRYVEFGLIPNQIMTKECPKREKKEDIIKGKEITDLNAKLKIYKCKKNNIKIKDITDEEEIKETKKNNNKSKLVLNPKMFSNDKILQFDGYTVKEKKINYLIFEKSYSEELLSCLEIDSENMMHYYFYVYKNQRKCSLFCNRGKTLILGGFYDGSIKIINLNKGPINTNKKLIPFKSKEPIIVLALDNEEKFLFVGNTIGNIIIFAINLDTFELEKKFYSSEHLSEISVIDVNNELNLWISASVDGIINLYTMPGFNLVRSLKLKNGNKIEYAFLSTSSLPSIIIMTDTKKMKEIYSYSINGKLLECIKDLNSILSPIIVKDINFNEYLIYISKDNNSIIIRNLPFLTLHNTISGFEKISELCINEDNRLLYAINDENEQVYIIKDDPKQIISN